MANALKSSTKNLKIISIGEMLWILRKRKGLSQAKMAASLKLSARTYWEWETDIRPSEILILTLTEQLRIARRRCGSLRKTASLLGVSHPTLLAREAAGDGDLIRRWRRLGYRFVN